MTIDDVAALGREIDHEIAKAVVDQSATVRLMLVALLSGGHVLLEGPPGTAKTLLAQSFARSLALDFGRIQFTPDLMPGDIIGASLFNFQTSAFALTRGPVFCDLLLADEINRTPPKTQAALLEAMQERAVTLDGRTEPLSERFTVVATQNPIEHQGVYPLPEAQLDRFLFRIDIGYPPHAAERAIVARHGDGAHAAMADIAPVADARALSAAIDVVQGVRLVEDIVDYIVALVRSTREHADLSSGASPRAAAALARAARAAAALDGRDYVIPDDVKHLAPALLRHRLVLSPAADIDGRRIETVVADLIDRVEAPR